jgi:arylsulfatase A
MPTLAELAGAEPPPGIDGISVVPTLLGKPGQKQHEFLYWESSGFDGQTGLMRPNSLVQAGRMGDWKGIRNRPQAPLELYNLANDVGETTNVANQHPQIVAKIAAFMATAHVDPPPQLEPEAPPGRAFR